MTEALYALAGALVGVLGTVLTALVTARHEEQYGRRNDVRSVCADLAAEVTHLQDISHQLRKDPQNAQLQGAAEDAHSRARGLQERLRLTSRSRATQEAGRWLLHCAYYQWRSTQGGRGDFWVANDSADRWLTALHAEGRKELGLGRSDLYKDPAEGLPIPEKPTP